MAVGCVEPGVCELVEKPFGEPCSDGDPCTTTDRCVSGICTGVLPPLDSDCDGFSDTIESSIGCDPDDFFVVPTHGVYYSGSRALASAAEAMLSWYSPRQRDVWIDTDPACDPVGSCGENGFCDAGKVADPCNTDEDCAQPPSTCRLVLNFGNIGDMRYHFVKLRKDLIEQRFPIIPGCALKVDLEIPEFKRRLPLRFLAEGFVDGRFRKDRDAIRFRKPRPPRR
jgi:hypothetical protein